MDFTNEISRLLNNQIVLQQKLVYFEQQIVNITKNLKSANINKADEKLLLKALKIVKNNVCQCRKLLRYNSQEGELLCAFINKYDNCLTARKAKQNKLINAFIQGNTHKFTLCVSAA